MPSSSILVLFAFSRYLYDLMKFAACEEIMWRFRMFLRMAHEELKLEVLQRQAKGSVCKEMKCLNI
jgi:hypothetical protein